MTSASEHDKGPLLGQQVAGSEVYDTSLLFPVPRRNARASLPGGRFDAYGEDVWHAYELSWLSITGMPRMFVGTLRIPCSSRNLAESKSLKLYLNSLNNHHFSSDEEARSTICRDVSRVVEADVDLTLCAVDEARFQGEHLKGVCMDDREVSVPDKPDSEAIKRAAGDGVFYTHLMRSRCPVTDQPDWATMVIETHGVTAEPDSLLAYLLAYRNHQEFHEQCVERTFADLWARLEPEYLSVHALYTRRGGLDISPWRCSEDRPAPLYRLNRQ